MNFIVFVCSIGLGFCECSLALKSVLHVGSKKLGAPALEDEVEYSARKEGGLRAICGLGLKNDGVPFLFSRIELLSQMIP